MVLISMYVGHEGVPHAGGRYLLELQRLLDAETELTKRFNQGVLQANGTMMAEPVFDSQYVADAVLYMASLPLDANVQFLTITATTMPKRINAGTTPLATKAMSTAAVPASSAPRMGMKAARKTSAESGTASGMPSTKRPIPTPTASTTATAKVART